MTNKYKERVEAVRRLMALKGWDAVVIVGSDPHASEYPAPRWKQVEWISGFTGEAADVVITMDEAGLWTDSRYFIQANAQLDGTGISLHKTRVPGAVGIPEWLSEHASVVAVDGKCLTVSALTEIENALASTHADGSWEVRDVPDLLDVLWTDRPSVPCGPVFTVDEGSVGETRLQKIVWLRKFLIANDCTGILFSALDEIAWLLNIRGRDIDYNPYAVSWLYVSLDKVCWCVKKNGGPADPDSVDSFTELRADDVTLLDYDDVYLCLSETDEDDALGRIFIDPSTLNANLYKYVVGVYGKENVVQGDSPVILRKAVKNSMETEGMREAHLEDGVVMERFLYWLEKSVESGETVTEYDAAVKLDSLRAEIPGYRGNSFETISAYGENAALPHYSTPRSGSAVIQGCGLYLVDSGGQYLFGTTDITRTIPMGECTPLEKEDYTLVLKGMIALAQAVFPEGTAGCQIDALARIHLWRSKRNFGHGTGHGVGFYLGVHEGPQSIRQNFNPQALLPGMITSDEPGIYREGMHGIRHENLLLCRENGSNEFGKWLSFETLTLCHIDTSAVVRELMTPDELRWLNNYNHHVFATLSPRLEPGEAEWLGKKTAPIL